MPSAARRPYDIEQHQLKQLLRLVLLYAIMLNLLYVLCCRRPKLSFAKALTLTLWAIFIGIRAVIGAVIAGSIVGYKVGLHCDFSYTLFWFNCARL